MSNTTTAAKLHDFFVNDDLARRSAILWSIGIGAFIGWSSSEMVGLRLSVALTAFSSALIFGWQVRVYATKDVVHWPAKVNATRRLALALPIIAAAEAVIIAAVVVRERYRLYEQGTLTAKISSAAEDPTLTQNQLQAQEALQEAKQKGLSIPPDVISKAAKSFINASKQDPAALNTALQCVSYRSAVLNSQPDYGPPRDAPPSFKSTLDMTVVGPDGRTLPPEERERMIPNFRRHVVVYGIAPPDEAALVEKIERANVPPEFAAAASNARFAMIDLTPNPPLPNGEKLLVRLDGMRLRNVGFKGGNFVYTGQPVDFNNVYFVDCTFINPRNLKIGLPASRPDRLEKFTERLSESSAINFNAP